MIGFMPAWRAIPAGMGAGIESASDTMKDLMGSASLDPAATPAKLSQAFTALSQDTGTAASKGAPGAPATAASSQATLMTANVALTATWTTASAVPGGKPAADAAYTLAIKAAAAAAMSAAMSAMAGMADMHICPIPVPIPPHGPGFVTKGSKSVFINKLPACREGDKVFEAAGGSDPIALGCQTVLIGDDGGGPATPDNAAAVAEAVAEAAQNAQAQSTAAALVAASAAGTPLIEVCPQCAQMRRAATTPKHTFTVRVVDDFTDLPIAGVQLNVTLPDGTVERHITDAQGRVHVDDLDTPGMGSVACELKDLRLRTTLDFVGLGEGRLTPDEASQFDEAYFPRRGASLIAEIVEHKVKTGESIKSLADANGMTWQELAKFNWDTDVPDKINEHLRDDVGCAKRAPDGRNLKFDSADEPGVVFVPRPWSAEGLATDMEHIIRVRVLSYGPRLLRIRLFDPDGQVISNAPFRVTIAGSTHKGEANEEGWLEVDLGKATLPDRCTVEWGESEAPEALIYALEVELRAEEYEGDEALRRRLHNFGYTKDRPVQDNVARFQHRYGLESTGKPEDIRDVVMGEHDDTFEKTTLLFTQFKDHG